MNPSLSAMDVALSPDVVSPVGHKAGVVTESSAHGCEAISPFAASTGP